MSRLLLRKTLELYEEEDKKKQSIAGSPRKSQQKRSGSNTIFKKAFNKKKKQQRKERIKDSIQDLQMKCVLDEVKKRKDADLTIDNISVLQKISKQSTIESVPIEKILTHQKGRLAKNIPTEKKLPKEKSVFSEADFDNFEKQYFVKLRRK